MLDKILNKTAYKLYNAGWTLAIPLLKRKKRIAEGFSQRIFKNSKCFNADIWIQAASGGEAYLVLELLKKIRFKRKLKVFLTSNTRQGIEILEQGAGSISCEEIEINISYSPFDKPGIIKRAINEINPKVMVLIELEMWPGLLKALKEKKCRTIIVNGRLTEKSFKGYMKWPSLWREMAPAKVLAISEDDSVRFKKLFTDSDVEVMNNIKFDRINEIESDCTKGDDNPLEKLKPEKKVVVLGSVRAEEELQVENIIRYLYDNSPETVIWLFPRHLHRTDHWKEVLNEMKISFCFRSDFKSNCDVVIWDAFGELGLAYRLADAAFVGGSLAPLGGQNFLEVLATGLIPVTGPSWENFLWTGKEIVENGLLHLEDDWQKVAEKLIFQLRNGQDRDEVKRKVAEYLFSHKGGTGVACEKIETLLEEADV